LDFLTDREFVVDINKVKSTYKKITVGCVQGSVLGPCLFSLYCRDLEKVIRANNADLVTYADDTYVIVRGNNRQEIINEAEETLKKHYSYLDSIGMVVNKGKTELTLFSRLNETCELNIGSTIIKSTPELKVLGINFSHNLDWTKQTLVAIGKANGYIRRLQIIRKFLTKETALKLITAFYFSMVYYGSVIWMTPDLKYKNWRLLEAAHYRVLRVAVQDYSRNLTREKIDQQCSRATPREWAAYASSSMAIKVVERETPRWLSSDLRSTLYINDRRRNRPIFLDRSRTKIGKQCFKHRLNSIFKCINFDWYGLNPSNDTLRVELKKSFFKYYN